MRYMLKVVGKGYKGYMLEGCIGEVYGYYESGYMEGYVNGGLRCLLSGEGLELDKGEEEVEVEMGLLVGRVLCKEERRELLYEEIEKDMRRMSYVGIGKVREWELSVREKENKRWWYEGSKYQEEKRKRSKKVKSID